MSTRPREFEPRLWHLLILPERLWLKRIVLFLDQLKNFSLLSWNPFLLPFLKSKNFLTPKLSWPQKYCFWGPIFVILNWISTKCMHTLAIMPLKKNKKKTLKKSQNLFQKYSKLIGYTHRCDPQKQQFLFASSAQKSI